MVAVSSPRALPLGESRGYTTPTPPSILPNSPPEILPPMSNLPSPLEFSNVPPPPTAPQQNQIFHYKKYLYLIKRSELDSLSAVMPMQRTVFSQRVYVSSGIKLLCAPEKIFLFKFFSWCWCSVCCFPTQGGMPPCQAVCCFPTQGLNYCGALHHFRCDDTYAR